MFILFVYIGYFINFVSYFKLILNSYGYNPILCCIHIVDNYLYIISPTFEVKYRITNIYIYEFILFILYSKYNYNIWTYIYNIDNNNNFFKLFVFSLFFC